nr:hypothetical protein [Tanacetum cinerariifolium]
MDAEHGKAEEGGATESPKATKGPARPVEIKEPDFERIQPLPDVQGKRKEKMCTPMPTEASGYAESPSLDAELALADSETESNNVVSKIDTRDQDEGQAGPNPGNHDEGQAGPNPNVQDKGQSGLNPGDAADSKPQSSHVFHVGPNLEHMYLEATNASTRQNPKEIDEEFTITTYPKDQKNLKLPSEDLEEEPGKTNAEAEVQSMVSVPIHQDTSLVPPMTTPVIDLMTLQSGSLLPTSTSIATTLIITTTTSLPSPPQPSTADPILVKRIAYETPAENSLLLKTGDMMNFLNWYCRQVNKIELTQAYLEGKAYEVVKSFYPDFIHLYKGSSLVLSISKIKAASYPDFGLKLLMQEQMWIDEVCTYDISAKYGISHWWFNRKKFYIDRYDSPLRRKEVKSHMRILSVIRIKAYSRYGYDYLSEIVLRKADLQEYTIAEKDFKNLYPSDFEDLNLLLLQGHLDHLLGSDKWMLSTTVKLWTRNLVIRQ